MGRELTLSDAPAFAATRRMATGLLLVMALVFLCALHYERGLPWLGFVRAFAEAAVIGALADWFAVTALFRRPLGLPIPHTAIIPRNKDRIGASLGRFIEQNFLAAPLVAARVAQVDFAGRLAHWLAEPRQAAWIAGGLAGLLPRMLHALDDSDLRRFARTQLDAGLRAIEVAPLAAEVLAVLTRGQRHQEVLTRLVDQVIALLEEFKPQLREKVRQEVWWGLRAVQVDEILYKRIVDAIDRYLEEIRSTPAHQMRQRFDAAVERLIADLRTSGAHREKAEALKERLLQDPALQGYLGGVWAEIRDRILEDAARPDSAIRAQLQLSIMNLGRSLVDDAAMQGKFNQWLRAEIVAQVGAHGHQAAALIADTVRRWDAETVTRKVEAEIGTDLQYIRINGTLIGGLAGLVLHALQRFV